MEDSKHWLASRTIWANVIAFIAAVATAFGLDLGLTPETQTAIVGGAIALVNVVLRAITTKPITG